MTYAKFNAFCRKLTATTYVMQWGGSHVWKVGGKVFAIGGWQDDEPSFTFKVSDIACALFKDQPGLRPAPYLASRGMTWILREARFVRCSAPRLYSSVVRDRFAGTVEEKARRARACGRDTMNAATCFRRRGSVLLPMRRRLKW
jgi:predicted DNA-binding protein (MmcQ/YjbR family)